MRPVCSSRAVRDAWCHRQGSNLANRFRRPVPSSRRTGAMRTLVDPMGVQPTQLSLQGSAPSRWQARTRAPAWNRTSSSPPSTERSHQRSFRGSRRFVSESNRFHSIDSRAAIPIASRSSWGERWESNPRFQGHILACCRNTSSTVGVAGIEPAISSSRTRRDTRLRYIPSK